MAVISVCSTKGGVGKTTLVICLADAFARQGGRVAIVDADPNGHIATWRARAGSECEVGVMDEADDTTLLAKIDDAASRHTLVLVDLEGAATRALTQAIAASDLVLIPTKVSGMDLQEVFRTYEVVRRTEQILDRPIQARVVFTQMSPLLSKVALHARREIEEAALPVMKTEIVQRVAYQAIHFTGATPTHPQGDPKAAREVNAVLGELIEALGHVEPLGA